MQPATSFQNILWLKLFNRLMWKEITDYAPLPLLICLLELFVCLSVCLLVLQSSLHPLSSKQYATYPRQVVIVTVLQRILKVDLNVQYKRMEGGPENNPELNLFILSCCLLLSAPLYLIETAVQAFSLVSFLSLFHPPSLVSPFPSSFVGELMGGVLKWRVSSYLPPIETWRQ